MNALNKTHHTPYMKYILFHKNSWIQVSSFHSFPQQQHSCEQHSTQPKHARAVQSCVNAIAHWLFILEKHWMQHIQQHLSHSLPQQFEAALMMSSAASGNFGSSTPGRMFSAVAFKLPKPTPKFCSIILLWPWESTFEESFFCGNCLHKYQKKFTLWLYIVFNH